MTKSNLKKKGFISVYTSTSQSIIEEIQGRTLNEDSKVGTEAETARTSANCIVAHGLLRRLSYTIHEHQVKSPSGGPRPSKLTYNDDDDGGGDDDDNVLETFL